MTVDLPYEDPYRPPEAEVLERPPEPGSQPPVPWEDTAAHPGFWKRLGAMFSLLFSNPMELADRVPVTEGLAPAWRFNVLLALPYLAFMGVLFAFIGSVSALAPSDPHMPRAFMAAVFGGEMLFFALLVFVGMFIYGAIAHAMLWMWGGTRDGRGLAQSIRFCGYAWGFVHLGMVVPCFGGLVALAGLVYVGMGLARIHRTDTWRGICAVLTPLFFCCCGYALIFAFAMSMGAFSH